MTDFETLVEPHRAALRAHCYRMLGSFHDAEDALQETMLRAWRGLSRFEGRSSVRSWLYTIATNVCLDAIAQRPKRVLPIDYDPAEGESAWLEPFPDAGLDDGLDVPDARYEQREAVELAFVAALQHLPARQRAALIMRDVLGFSAKEVAGTLDTTLASAKSALQRARKTIDERLPERSQQATLRTLGDERVTELVRRYMDALDRDDVDTVVAMLTEDATIAMPPTPEWYAGRDAMAAFFAAGPMSGSIRWRHVPTRANGQVAVACYTWETDEGAYVARVLDVLTLRASRITAITSFVDPEVFADLGLPGRLP
jgi:RNA polymerase sigma-70 factor, ECF subfamily